MTRQTAGAGSRRSEGTARVATGARASASPGRARLADPIVDRPGQAIIERAASRATAAQRKAIADADSLLPEASRSRDVESFLRADASWHEAVTEACQNPVMIDAMRRQREAIALSRDTTVRAMQLDRVTQRFHMMPSTRREQIARLAYAMHHAVTKAILQGNPRRANRAMADLIDGIDGILLKTFGH